MLRNRLGGVAVLAAGLLLSCTDATGPSAPGAATVTPEAATVSLTYLGQSRPVVVVVRDASGAVLPGAEVEWVSVDPSVAQVSDDGVVTATGNGSTTVRATAGDAAAGITVSVDQVMAALTLSESEWSFPFLGDTLRLAAVAVDSGGSAVTGPELEWSSLDPSVVAVSEAGLLTAVADGSTAVTVSGDGLVASAAVTVEQRPGDVLLGSDSLRFVSLGDTLTVRPEVRDGGGSVIDGPDLSWASADPSVVTVQPSGLLSAVGPGTTEVTVTAGMIQLGIHVTVEQVVASLQIEGDSLVLADPGDTGSAEASAFDARGNAIADPPIVWVTRDASVVTVDAVGAMTAEGTGTTWVAALVGAVGDSIPVRVEPELALVTLGDTAPSGQVATELSLAARVQDVLGDPYGGATVRWTTDPGSGSIVSDAEPTSDATGHVSAVWRLGTASGPQTAHASLESRGATVTVSFTASAEPGPAVEASLTADSVLLSAQGETVFLAPAYFDAFGNVTSGSGVAWSSANPAVATVASDGLVTGVAAGSTWMTGSLGAASDSLLVTVEMRGAITVTFDDGWRTVYENAWPVLQSLDLPANVAVYTEAVGWPAYMTQAHLDELHAAGWAMVSHTVTHDSLPTLSVGELDYELRASQEWLDQRGYRGSNVFVAPYHEFEDREKIAASSYYTAARGYSANTVSPDSLVTWMPDRPYDLTGIEADGLPYTTQAGRDALRALLQRTRDEGTFVDLFFHHVPSANAADFQAVMEVVAEFRERVLPYDRLYPVWARVVY